MNGNKLNNVTENAKKNNNNKRDVYQKLRGMTFFVGLTMMYCNFAEIYGYNI